MGKRIRLQPSLFIETRGDEFYAENKDIADYESGFLDRTQERTAHGPSPGNGISSRKRGPSQRIGGSVTELSKR
jgi:hypothetical protein